MSSPVTQGFPHSSVGKESACNAGDPGSIPGLGRSAGKGIAYPRQCSWASLVVLLVKNNLQCRRPGFDPWVGRIPWRRDRLPTPIFLGFPGGSAGTESACNAGDLGLIPGLGRSPEGDMATHSRVLAWGILMDSGDWWAAVHGVAKSRTRLSDFHF